MIGGIRWAVRDRYENDIYITKERWQHIIDKNNHPEMSAYEKQLEQTIISGNRKQDSLNPKKYRYTKSFANLKNDNTHIVAIVLFKLKGSKVGKLMPNNYIVTAYQKTIG